MKVEFSRPAHRDLIAIEDWFGHDNPAAAIRIADDLMRAARGLGRFPPRFRAVPGTDIRRRAVGPYLIFYRVTDRVEIVRILHGARDWLALLEDPD